MKKSVLYIILVVFLFSIICTGNTSYATSIEKTAEDLGNNTFKITVKGNIDKKDRKALFLVDYNRSAFGNFTDYKDKITALADTLFKDENYNTEIILVFYGEKLAPKILDHNKFTDLSAFKNRLDDYQVHDAVASVNLQKVIKSSRDVLDSFQADKKEMYIFSNQISRTSNVFNSLKTSELKNPDDYIKIGEEVGDELFGLNNFSIDDFEESDIDYLTSRNIGNKFGGKYKCVLIFRVNERYYYIEYASMLKLEEKFSEEKGIEIYPTYSNANTDKLYEYSAFSNTRQIDDLIEFKKEETPHKLKDSFKNFQLTGDVLLTQSGEQRILNPADNEISADLKAGDFNLEYRIKPARGSVINGENTLPKAVISGGEEYKSETVSVKPTYVLTIKNIGVDAEGNIIGEPLSTQIIDGVMSYEDLENYVKNIKSPYEFKDDTYNLFHKSEFLLKIEDKDSTVEIKWVKKDVDYNPAKPAEDEKTPEVDEKISDDERDYSYPQNPIYIKGYLYPMHIKETKKEIDSYRVKIYLDDYKYQLIVNDRIFNRKSDVKPLLYDSKTYIPLRFLSEALGYKVHYDDATRNANISKGDFAIDIDIDGFTIKKNGDEVFIEDKIINVEGRLMLPLRSIFKILNLQDYEIEWNEEEKSVTISVNLR
ncbi:Hypothetical protein ING2D1G_0372 [Peptoniphilus sp. ING2-D1G]|nr:Hypothetical protein ING2D1G_0372 [Peptoniphilus sp. ING2-D1G]